MIFFSFVLVRLSDDWSAGFPINLVLVSIIQSSTLTSLSNGSKVCFVCSFTFTTNHISPKNMLWGTYAFWSMVIIVYFSEEFYTKVRKKTTPKNPPPIKMRQNGKSQRMYHVKMCHENNEFNYISKACIYFIHPISNCFSFHWKLFTVLTWEMRRISYLNRKFPKFTYLEPENFPVGTTCCVQRCCSQCCFFRDNH